MGILEAWPAEFLWPGVQRRNREHELRCEKRNCIEKERFNAWD